MPLSYEKNKQHIYKWRDVNRLKLSEINKKSNKKRYILNKEFEIYRNILLEN